MENWPVQIGVYLTQTSGELKNVLFEISFIIKPSENICKYNFHTILWTSNTSNIFFVYIPIAVHALILQR